MNIDAGNIKRRQEELEKKAVQDGKCKYDGLSEESKLGRVEWRFWKDHIEPFVAAIKHEKKINEKKRKSRGRPTKFSQFINVLSPGKLTLITLHEVFSSWHDLDGATLTNIAMNICNSIEKTLDNRKDKIKIAQEFRNSDKGQRCHLGSELLKLLERSSNLIEIRLLRESKKKTTYRVLPTEQTNAEIQNNKIRYEKLVPPLYKPMICKPKIWKTLEKGGYFLLKTSFVRGLGKEQESQLKKANFPNVFRAVNIIQETPWRINESVFNVMKKCNELNISLVTLEEHKLKKPRYFILKKKRRDKYWQKERERLVIFSKNFQAMQIFGLAEEYLDETLIFFPHHLDWRGRVYPYPPNLNPQGSDCAKALLEFADGKSLGEMGHFWLAVHIANFFGQDKCSFEERHKWVLENEREILSLAERPLDNKEFWRQTKEKPWRALAACFEWHGYRKYGKEWISHIPVAMDGTCNGLQHYSALGRDKEGGRATNLRPAERPEDIYTEVLNIVKERRESDAKENTENKEAAKNWEGHISRNTVKRGVMTTPYGVQGYGLRKQLIELLEGEKLKKASIPKGDISKNAQYLSRILKDAIEVVVKSAPDYMRWFRRVAELLAQENRSISWTTPLGFVIVQDKKSLKKITVRIRSFETENKLTLKIEDPKAKLSIKKNQDGLPPNFIQSLDATHLMMTILEAKDKYGMSSFAVVHDSFGVHAAECEQFSPLIRETFIKLHSRNILKEFRDSLCSCNSSIKLPELPSHGELDINDVLQSKYLFS